LLVSGRPNTRSARERNYILPLRYDRKDQCLILNFLV
jgi:hypothetical protein